MKSNSLGRCLFGLTAVFLGVCTLVWHDFIWQLEPTFSFAHADILIDCAAVVQIVGGVAILSARTTRAGAMALGIVYGIYSLLWLPQWFQRPIVYDGVGNFFEQFALVSGALVLYGAKTERIGYYGFGLSVVSFALYQAFYMHVTAGLVPTWIPPGQMFWAVVTTIAFALAAGALLSGRSALLAARLTTLMIVGFGLLIWVPATILAAHTLTNWSETGVNFGIAGAAWIVTDFLFAQRAHSDGADATDGDGKRDPE